MEINVLTEVVEVRTYELKLTEREASALRIVLGNVAGDDGYGIRQALDDIWASLDSELDRESARQAFNMPSNVDLKVLLFP